MCFNPIQIQNKGYRRLGGLPSVVVPCGKCDECNSLRSQDYFVRAWSLYKSLDPTKWSVFFCTLTFRQEDVPVHLCYEYPEDMDFNLNELSESDYNRLVENSRFIGETLCFDHSIIRRFLKSYRQYYRRLFSTYEERDVLVHIPLRTCRDGRVISAYDKRVKKRVCTHLNRDRLPHILVTCEYGETTHRPHYHAIVMIPRVLSASEFKKEIERFWHYGFTCDVSLVHKDGMVLQRNIRNCFKYVLKYVSKGSGWLPSFVTKKNQFFFDLRYSDYVPRVFTTNGFGAPLESFLCDDNYISGKVTFSVDGKPESFLVPRYNMRRRFTVVSLKSSRDYFSHDVVSMTSGIVRRSKRYDFVSSHVPEYDAIRKSRLIRVFRRHYADFVTAQPQYKDLCSMNDFVLFMMRDYNRNWLDYHPLFRFNSFIDLEYDFEENRWKYEKKVVPLFPKPLNDSIYVRDVSFERLFAFLRGFTLHCDSCRCARFTNSLNKKAYEMNFYRLHRVCKSLF